MGGSPVGRRAPIGRADAESHKICDLDAILRLLAWERRAQQAGPLASDSGSRGATGGTPGEDAATQEGALQRVVPVHAATAEPGDLPGRDRGRGWVGRRCPWRGSRGRSGCRPTSFASKCAASPRSAVRLWGPGCGAGRRPGRADRRGTPRVADALHLSVLAERVGHLQIPRLDLGADTGRVQQRLVGQGCSSSATRSSRLSATMKSAPWVLNASTGPVASLLKQPFLQHFHQAFAGDVGVLLGARQARTPCA